MIGSIVTSIIAFISTNIDDIFILMLLYAQVETKIGKKYIVLGQYFGIGILVLLSLLGAFGLTLISQKYVGLLGIIPIILGLKALVDGRKKKYALLQKDETDTETEAKNSTQLIQNQEYQKRWELKRKAKVVITKIIKPEILSVMLITTAHGADNIGVYIPLFSGYSVGQLITAIFLFALMIGLWCFLGSRFADSPVLKVKIKQYKHIIVPAVLIGLGVYIIADAFGWWGVLYKSLYQ